MKWTTLLASTVAALSFNVAARDIIPENSGECPYGYVRYDDQWCETPESRYQFYRETCREVFDLLDASSDAIKEMIEASSGFKEVGVEYDDATGEILGGPDTQEASAAIARYRKAEKGYAEAERNRKIGEARCDKLKADFN